jgi:DNA polymerase III sliding clamp (beta) subunit (PCNA family)
LAAATLCASYQDVRYYLNGVLIEPHEERGITLTATNGHKLVSIHDEDGALTNGDSFILAASTRDAFIKAARTKSGRGKPVHITAAPDDANYGVLVLEHGDTRYRALKVDGTFPNWRTVMQGPTDKGASATFDPRYIADFAAVEGLLHEGAVRGMRLTQNEETSAARVEFSAAPYAVGVLMPIRV